ADGHTLTVSTLDRISRVHKEIEPLPGVSCSQNPFPTLMNTLALSLLAIPLYLAAGVLFALRLVGRVSRETFTPRRLLAIVTVALVLHALLLWQHLFTPEGLNF